jgi:hypothetical protein
MKSKVFVLGILMVLSSCKETAKGGKTEIEDIEYSQNTNDESGWTSLFDGTSFDSWRGYLSNDMYPEWDIVDGVMVFTPGEKSGKNIITKKKYTNFILSLEWKISEGGNSGIFYGVYEDEKYVEAYETGVEIQVIDNKGHPDALEGGDSHKAGSLFDLVAYPDQYILPSGEWNLCVLEINHEINQGKITMNDKETITFPLYGPLWEDMIENSKFKDWQGFGKHRTGHIGLQDHHDKVWYRNIKIKEL